MLNEGCAIAGIILFLNLVACPNISAVLRFWVQFHGPHVFGTFNETMLHKWLFNVLIWSKNANVKCCFASLFINV
jgi:hypothetical protein